jgi:hypothetical protein
VKDITIKDQIWKELEEAGQARQFWSKLEDDILIEFWRITSTGEISRVMRKHGFDRTPKAVRLRARALQDRGRKFKYQEIVDGTHGRT